MKKIIVILLMVFLTGCSANYNLTITNKNEVIENFTISVDNDKILEEYDSIEEYLDYFSNVYLRNDGYKNFKVKTKQGNFSSSFIVSKNYYDLNEYVNSYSFKSMFSNATVEQIGKYTTFTTSNNAYLESIKNGDFVNPEMQYKEFIINIKFYNEVVSSNATSINEKENIYTWTVSEKNKESFITFKIGPKVKYGVVFKDFIMNNILVVSIVSALIISLIVAIVYVYRKAKKNNQI